MAKTSSHKTFVVDNVDNTRIPFLRGILTKSLQIAGLEFDEAYKFSSSLRESISDRSEIAVGDLRNLVVKRLDQHFGQDAVKNYLECPQQAIPVQVTDFGGQTQPFSKGYLMQSLELCNIPPNRAYELSSNVEQGLILDRKIEVNSDEIAKRIFDILHHSEAVGIARRYLVWLEFSRSGNPLIVMMGGTTGCGKSTISAEIAHRLNIVRTQSTDMLREVMRLMIPERLLPALHRSSFDAWQAIPSADSSHVDIESRLISGYLTQAKQVSLGIEGVLRRAERERISLILEGIHVMPEFQKSIKGKTEAVVVPIILSVLKSKNLKRQLVGRGILAKSRRSSRYLENFESIWRLQSYLLSEADGNGVPIIPNDNQQGTIGLVMDTIAAELEKTYSGAYEELFQHSVTKS